MKTAAREPADAAAPIVQLAAQQTAAQTLPATPERARAFAEPLLAGRALDTGEDALAHADGVAAILQSIGAAPSLRAAAWLIYAADHLAKPEEAVRKAFGDSFAELVAATRKLVALQRAARDAPVADEARAQQTERVRKMLLAFSRDLRVVLLRLASRLQTLRWYATTKEPCPRELARESMQVFAPLANRLGIWPIKWELEDLAFRFLEPDHYREIARHLDARRVEREREVERRRRELDQLLRGLGFAAEVHGRPKHLYSIWKKMQGKALDFAHVFDVRALRVVVADVPACYAVLGHVHAHWPAVSGELDDYIARPKANGYQSLHTVVRDEAGRPVEIQIRTRAMHERADAGVAAHWAYKEAGARGHGAASGDFADRIAEARKAVLRQLLAWERDFAEEQGHSDGSGALFDDRVYVFTPAAQIVELATGSTPVDFAYALHTDLGHRCRGARVDGRVVPLNTALASGQTVEIVSAKEGGPSLDWLNAELGYLKGVRSKAKVRAWFNGLAHEQTIARGREAVEKLLQREGRTALKLDDLAAQLDFRNADALFEAVGKDEYSLRSIETVLRPAVAQPTEEPIALRRSRADVGGGVLVVGVESLMTTLARCCRPAPPDAIAGFVTRGRGVAIHRAECRNFRQTRERSPERVIAVAWGEPRSDRPALYPVDVLVEAADRGGLLRDISELFAKEKMNVTAANTQSVRDGGGDTTAWMSFTLEIADASKLGAVLRQVERVAGVRRARRR